MANIYKENAKQGLNQMKQDISLGLGIQMGADTPSRENGLIGGYMTKLLVEMVEEDLMSELY